ncbi:hypothetical protein BJG92_01760 [Arthrobacter sp. SO5]|uniref:hypothetical protein n=1 Tax=Arthrobacter sp. SO5 TaxID=1897055 RepID=UPI001E38A913|nr:hypothetical protein [Arthrobacter sp. SO5]MCB5274230.1 hypothetical protein [Arthrobacter sp. SO5]
MQLAAWIVLCLTAAFLLRTRVRVLITSVLCLWMLVPAVGNSLITGVGSGPLSLHAASWLILAIFVVRMLHDPWSIHVALARHFFLFLTLALVMAAAFLASATSQSGGGFVLLVDQIVVPVVFCLILLAEANRAGGLVALLRTVILALVAIVCVVAIAQWLTNSFLFYEFGYSNVYWFGRDSGRWMATLDQPLALSLVIALSAPLVAGLKRIWHQALLLALMVVGVLITQSRMGLAALAVTVAATLLFAKLRVWIKAAMLVGAAAVAAVIMASPLVAGVAARVVDDSGSAQARSLALDYFLSRWSSYALAGEGIGSSYRLANQIGLETSFENPILMYSIDFGLVFALLYFGAMLAVVVRKGPGNGYPGLMLAGIMAVIMPQTYSSLATRSAAGIIVWTVLAMVIIAGDEAQDRKRELRARQERDEASTAAASNPRDALTPAGPAG